MSVPELVQELESLDETELQEVALYVAFLKFRAWRVMAQPLPDASKLARLYAEFADEDRQLAEVDMNEYAALLQAEDVR
jgi:hypothetical protein